MENLRRHQYIPAERNVARVSEVPEGADVTLYLAGPIKGRVRTIVARVLEINPTTQPNNPQVVVRPRSAGIASRFSDTTLFIGGGTTAEVIKLPAPKLEIPKYRPYEGVRRLADMPSGTNVAVYLRGERHRRMEAKVLAINEGKQKGNPSVLVTPRWDESSTGFSQDTVMYLGGGTTAEVIDYQLPVLTDRTLRRVDVYGEALTSNLDLTPDDIRAIYRASLFDR